MLGKLRDFRKPPIGTPRPVPVCHATGRSQRTVCSKHKVPDNRSQWRSFGWKQTNKASPPHQSAPKNTHSRILLKHSFIGTSALARVRSAQRSPSQHNVQLSSAKFSSVLVDEDIEPGPDLGSADSCRQKPEHFPSVMEQDPGLRLQTINISKGIRSRKAAV